MGFDRRLQTARQGPGESRVSSSPELPSRKPRGSALWGSHHSWGREQPAPRALFHKGAPDRHRRASPAKSPRQVSEHLPSANGASWEQERSPFTLVSHTVKQNRHSLVAPIRPIYPPIKVLFGTVSLLKKPVTPPATSVNITGGTLGLKAWRAEKVPQAGVASCTVKCARMFEHHTKTGSVKKTFLRPLKRSKRRGRSLLFLKPLWETRLL